MTKRTLPLAAVLALVYIATAGVSWVVLRPAARAGDLGPIGSAAPAAAAAPALDPGLAYGRPVAVERDRPPAARPGLAGRISELEGRIEAERAHQAELQRNLLSIDEQGRPAGGPASPETVFDEYLFVYAMLEIASVGDDDIRRVVDEQLEQFPGHPLLVRLHELLAGGRIDAARAAIEEAHDPNAFMRGHFRMLSEMVARPDDFLPALSSGLAGSGIRAQQAGLFLLLMAENSDVDDPARERAREVVRRALGDPSTGPDGRVGLFLGMPGMRISDPVLEAALHEAALAEAARPTDDPDARRARLIALFRLREHPDDRSRSLLTRLATGDDDPTIRLAAVDGIDDFEDDAARAILEGIARSDADPDVRERAGFLLARWK